MSAPVEQFDALDHLLREHVSYTWAVIGQRVLEDGTEQRLIASAWGATEELARAFYERLQDLGDAQALPGDWKGPRWTSEQLTFVRSEDAE